MTNEVSQSPFHLGEQQVQEKLGVRHIEDWAQKVIRDFLPEQHRAFHTALPFLVVSARDPAGRPWVTILSGQGDFISSPDARHLVIRGKPVSGDGLESAFTPNADVGILGIELATRRRNRVNGNIVSNAHGEITFHVGQSFGNCPQYIREREWRRVTEPNFGDAQSTDVLNSKQKEWIENADTFFIGTGYRGDGASPTFGMDASHRGGERGFVEVLNSNQLRFPDFAGNNHYNTIGNLVLDPQAGFLFVDFSTGSLLQLTGTASIDWESEEIDKIPGARRLITLDIGQVIELPFATDLRWQEDAESVRSLRLVDKIKESSDVISFVFESRDGGPLANFEPGQHLPIELDIPGNNQNVQRTYSLSSAPEEERYRISVKRQPQGLVSNHLHDNMEVGSIISSRNPAGDFMMTCNICPLVLVSTGVGVTPMISILKAVAAEHGKRPVWFVHGARSSAHHPFADEVRSLVKDHANLNVHVAYSQPGPRDILGTDYDSDGRVTADLLADLTSNADAHYFLCGPTRFMAEVQAGLESQNVPIDQIHYETFGPAG